MSKYITEFGLTWSTFSSVALRFSEIFLSTFENGKTYKCITLKKIFNEQFLEETAA